MHIKPLAPKNDVGRVIDQFTEVFPRQTAERKQQAKTRGLLNRPTPLKVIRLNSGHKLHLSVHLNLEDAAPDWRNFQNTATHTNFQNYDWVKSWYETLGCRDAIQPFIVMGHIKNRMSLLLPLGIEETRFTKKLVWLAGDYNDYNAPLYDKAFAENLQTSDLTEIWQTIGDTAQPFGATYFFAHKQPKIIDGAANPFAGFWQHPFSAAAHAVHVTKPWEQYYLESRSSKTRRTMRTKEKRLRKEGDVEIKRATDQHERTDLVRKMLQWKSEALEKIGHNNPFDNDVSRRFFDQLVKTDEAGSSLLVYVLRVDNKEVAIALFLKSRGSRMLYQMAYDPELYTKHSPGRILLLHIFEDICDGRPVELDFGLGDEPYKREWCDTIKELTVSPISFSPLGSLYAFAALLRLKAKIFVKSNPKLLDLVWKANRFKKKLLG